MWIITRDTFNNGKSVGRCSRDYEPSQQTLLTHRFRMLDADREAYYEGLSSDGETEKGFDPLDDFGEGYAGCVIIEYFNAGRWRML